MDVKTLNDKFRKTLLGGKVMLTRGVFSKGQKAINEILDSVKTFNDFNHGNDPYNEHDYGSFLYDGEKIMWKIDYYDRDLRCCSDDPADITKTIRVMTVMLAEEKKKNTYCF